MSPPRPRLRLPLSPSSHSHSPPRRCTPPPSAVKQKYPLPPRPPRGNIPTTAAAVDLLLLVSASLISLSLLGGSPQFIPPPETRSLPTRSQTRGRIKSLSPLSRRRNSSLPRNLSAPPRPPRILWRCLGFEVRGWGMAVEEASSSSGGGGGSGEEGGCGGWTREQEKAFENALAATLGEDEDEDEEGDGMWERIAEAVEGKTPDEVRRHYELLVEDVDGIEAGRVPLLVYAGDGGPEEGSAGAGKKGGGGGGHGDKGSAKSAEQERRKGIAWTEDEHRLFLLGLEKYGKGDWRSISRNFVISRTPTQVASHAQKYFIRLNSMNRERRRSSIHDITSVNNGDASATQGPITGQPNGQPTNPGKPSKQSPQPANAPPGVDAYGTTIGQPVGGPLVSAVGTPVTLPVPAAPHIAYGMHAPVPGAVVPGAPVNMPPMPYPMPPPTSHG
ncbi:transcription factor SRM1-like [Oryza brachyantha]|nr:transcription factor SRM1-like [Oryza brachyantha]